MKCLNCSNDVLQTPKKRAKLYCSEKCRVEFCRKKKQQGTVKRGRGRPKKERVFTLQEVKAPTVVTEIHDLTAVKEVDAPILIAYPENFKALLDMAKNQAGLDTISFKAHVRSCKLTPNQREMIYSKLK